MRTYHHINPLTGEQGSDWDNGPFLSAGEIAFMNAQWKKWPLKKNFWSACMIGPFPIKQPINIAWA